MKILAIISSYRKKGHTSKVISLLEGHLKTISENGNVFAEFEKLFLGDYNINHCTGCRACMEYGEQYCPLKDDIPLLKSKIKNADAVIFATPVYVGDVSSSMKALIDRLAYICHRQEFYNKCAMIIATTNSTSLKRTTHTIAAATYSWGFKLLGIGGFKTESSNDSKSALQNRYNKDIRKLSKKLFKGIKNESYRNPSLISLASFKIQKRSRANPEITNSIDYKYWDDKGWTDPNREYYIDVKVGFLKSLLSKFLSGIFSIIF